MQYMRIFVYHSPQTVSPLPTVEQYQILPCPKPPTFFKRKEAQHDWFFGLLL